MYTIKLVKRPFTSEAPYLARERERILDWAGQRWALHQAHAVKRKPPPAARPYFGPP